jgi:hypothetical protein
MIMSDPGATSLPGVLNDYKMNLTLIYDGLHFHCIREHQRKA